MSLPHRCTSIHRCNEDLMSSQTLQNWAEQRRLSVYSFLTACVTDLKPQTYPPHPLTHTHTPFAHLHILPPWWFNLAAVARHEMGLNALKLNILSFWSAFCLVICSFWLIGLRLSPYAPHSITLPLSVCLVKLISLCCTFPLRHVLDKTSPSKHRGTRLHLLPEVDGWCGHWMCLLEGCNWPIGEDGYACLFAATRLWANLNCFAAV